MRGLDLQQDTLFSTVSPSDRVPPHPPLRPIREMVNQALVELDEAFEALYAPTGRDSIAPEKLLRVQLLMILYTIRSERMLMEQIDYNLLFRWFVGFSMDDGVWDHSTFTKNRRRMTLGADKNYDTQRFVKDLRKRKVTPHVAQNQTRRSSAMDARTTRHTGYRTSLTIRKRIEECFGWLKTVGGMRKSRWIGCEKLDFQFVLAFAAFNLVRMRNLGVHVV